MPDWALRLPVLLTKKNKIGLPHFVFVGQRVSVGYNVKVGGGVWVTEAVNEGVRVSDAVGVKVGVGGFPFTRN